MWHVTGRESARRVGLSLVLLGLFSVSGWGATTIAFKDLDLSANQAVAGNVIEVSVLVENSGAEQSPNLEIGFFYTEARTYRHGLIGKTTIDRMEPGTKLRPTVYWDTVNLTQGIYHIVAAVLGDPIPVTVNSTAIDPTDATDFVMIIRDGSPVIWPEVDGALKDYSKTLTGPILLCSTEWSTEPEYSGAGAHRVTPAQFTFTNLGSETIETGTVRTSFLFASDLNADPIYLEENAFSQTVASGAKRNLEFFVDLGLLAAKAYDELDDEVIVLGETVSVHLVFEFTPTAEEAIVYYPALDTGLSIHLSPDVEEFVFPERSTCSFAAGSSSSATAAASTSIAAITVAPAGGQYGRTYIASGSSLYALNRIGEYAGESSSVDVGATITAPPVWGYLERGTGTDTALIFLVSEDGSLTVVADELSFITLASQQLGFKSESFALYTEDDWGTGSIAVSSSALTKPAFVYSDSEDQIIDQICVGAEDGIHWYSTEGIETHHEENVVVDVDKGLIVTTLGSDDMAYAFCYGTIASGTGLIASNNTHADSGGLASKVMYSSPAAVSTELAYGEFVTGSQSARFALFGTATGDLVIVDANDTARTFPSNQTLDLSNEPIAGVTVVGSGTDQCTLYVNDRQWIYELLVTGVTSSGLPSIAPLRRTLQPSPSATLSMIHPIEILTMDDETTLLFATYSQSGSDQTQVAGFVVPSREDQSASEVELSPIRVELWADPFSAIPSPSGTEPKTAEFLFAGEAFTQPVTAARTYNGYRMLVGASEDGEGRVYSFDLSVSFGGSGAAGDTPTASLGSDDDN